MTNDCVVTNAGKDQDVEINLRGHWLYCRKCENPDVRDDTGEILIEIPDKSKDWNPHWQPTWLEVLGKGASVATPWNEKKRKELIEQYGIYFIPCMDDCYEIGDFVLCPNNHPWAVVHSPYAADEFFVSEVIPMAIYRELDNATAENN